MSAADDKSPGSRDVDTSPAFKKMSYRIPEGHAWAGLWKIFAGIGVVGLGISAVGYMGDKERFAFSYLFAFMLFLTVGLGALFFILIDRLTSAGWSVTVRRTAEFFAGGLPIFLLLFIPVHGSMGLLFPWLNEHEEAHAKVELIAPAYAQESPATTGAHREPARGDEPAAPRRSHSLEHASGAVEGTHAEGADPEHRIHEEVMAKKAPYLNRTFFIVRAVIYLLVWSFLATRLFGFSTRQDTTQDPKLTVAAQRFAPGATILFALTLTFAAFDWIMSLNPAWFSTIFGVTIFAGSVVAMYATLIVVTMGLRESGLIKDAITVEHFHDLGKLMFGFLIFWAYVSFSQFMLIWYAALPEETTFYHLRWDVGPWKSVSLFIVFAHFVVPFFLILSRNTKRRLPILRLGAMWLLAMHAVEMYWLIMPNYAHGEVSLHWLDATCLLGVGGIYLAAVFHRMTKHPLIPVGDPRLSRALSFENA